MAPQTLTQPSQRQHSQTRHVLQLSTRRAPMGHAEPKPVAHPMQLAATEGQYTPSADTAKNMKRIYETGRKSDALRAAAMRELGMI